MSRSIWKIKPYLKSKIINYFKVYNSNFIITKDFVGIDFFVYSGNKFKKLNITDSMVGHYLSEFVFTKYVKRDIHIKDKRRKKHK
jgi:ribosomal protein S19